MVRLDVVVVGAVDDEGAGVDVAGIEVVALLPELGGRVGVLAPVGEFGADLFAARGRHVADAVGELQG